MKTDYEPDLISGRVRQSINLGAIFKSLHCVVSLIGKTFMPLLPPPPVSMHWIPSDQPYQLYAWSCEAVNCDLVNALVSFCQLCLMLVVCIGELWKALQLVFLGIPGYVVHVDMHEE